MDKLNSKNTKITLPLSQSDDHSFSKLSILSQDDFKIPKRKKTKTITESLVTAPEVTQDQDDMEKVIKLAVALKDQNRHKYV